METKLNFYAKDKPLAEVLFSQRKYRIPRYQRPYAWDLEEVSEFWEDLKDNEEPYFFGSFIFNTETQDEDGCVDVIDDHEATGNPPTATLVSRCVADSPARPFPNPSHVSGAGILLHRILSPEYSFNHETNRATNQFGRPGCWLGGQAAKNYAFL